MTLPWKYVTYHNNIRKIIVLHELLPMCHIGRNLVKHNYVTRDLTINEINRYPMVWSLNWGQLSHHHL